MLTPVLMFLRHARPCQTLMLFVVSFVLHDLVDPCQMKAIVLDLPQTTQRGLSKESTINDLEKVVRAHSASTTCPRDSCLGSAFVDSVLGESNVGAATHMLSYTWAYAIGEIAESLQEWSKSYLLDPKRSYIWMCWACVNQHRVQDMRQRGEFVPFEEFRSVFEGRVRSIGKNL